MRALAAGAIFAAVLIGTSASAADLPRYQGPPAVAPAYNWSGLYLGMNGGGGWGHRHQTYANGEEIGSGWDGALFGFQIGYNWQFSNWIFGLELGSNAADISGSSPCPNSVFTCAMKVRSFGTLRGRAGWAFDNALLYVTGGYAAGTVRRQATNSVNGDSLTQDDTHGGWTVGAGVDFGFTRNWIARVEYLHVDLGDATYPGAIVGNLEF